jgi:ring-1,2-phenylacetyl-CoA epoxidase subunit PaaD
MAMTGMQQSPEAEHRMPDVDTVHALLKQVADPEIPVLTIADLGVLRDVRVEDGRVIVVITPTYSGCPAMKAIEDEVYRVLRDSGLEQVEVRTQLAPAWTTDWMSAEGRRKLREYGIAPPAQSGRRAGALADARTVVQCPRCGSESTGRISEFGSTACKALYRCTDCLEPFDYFKCI